MALLETIHGPVDVKRLDRAQLPQLAAEIRQRIIDVTAVNGGHIGPNLGVVELTLALHRVFHTPEDKFVFDVSHQAYVHKLLTGRHGPEFDKLRLTGGHSGFMNRSESAHDCFGAGHAGTGLSAALGFAVARDRAGRDNHVVALLGDAAFTCGVTLEALNNVAASTKKLVIILNDNEWSIAKNVGALSRYFNEIITHPAYNKFDRDFTSFLEKVPGGEALIEFGRKWRRETKDFFVGSSNIFEAFGVRYIGPIDGHDLDLLERHLEFAKQSEVPILLHVLTKKGKGYEPAMAAPEKFHGLGPFNKETGKTPPARDGTPPNYQDAFGKNLLKYAQADKKIVGITAAMPPGTGLSFLRETLPEQFFDVGIAEEHAVLFAAAMAADGFRPVVAIYSTFLQRAYDQIIHDVCLQNLPVTFCMDRAGLSPNDGATHHGLFDIGYLRCVPNVVLMQPKDEDELADMLWTAVQHPGPAFIRYPRGNGLGVACKAQPQTLPIGVAEVLREGAEIQFWALGPWIQDALMFAEQLERETGRRIGVVNARFAKPLDVGLLRAQAAAGTRRIVTFEDHVVQGGFGGALVEAIADLGLDLRVTRIGWPDAFVDHASSAADLRAAHGLAPEAILARLRELR